MPSETLLSIQSGKQSSIGSTIPFFQQVVIRETVLIVVGFLILAICYLTAGIFYARSGVVEKSGKRILQMSSVMNSVSHMFQLRARQNVRTLTKALELLGQEGLASALQDDDPRIVQLVNTCLAYEESYLSVEILTVSPDGGYRLAAYTRDPQTNSFIGGDPGQTKTFSIYSMLGDPGLLTISTGIPSWSLVAKADDGVQLVPNERGITQEMLMRYTVPLQDEFVYAEQGSFGLVSLACNMDWLLDLMQKSLEIEDVGAILLSPQGMYIWPDKTFFSGLNVDFLRQFDKKNLFMLGLNMQSGNTGSMRIHWSGKQHIAMYMPLIGQELYFAVLLPEKFLYGQLNLVTFGFGLLVILVCLLAGSCLFKTITLLLRPLPYMASMAEALACGDFDMRDQSEALDFLGSQSYNSTVRRYDEPGRLLRAAEKLRHSLKQRVQDLTVVAGVRERLSGELNLARSVQEGILPKELPKLTNLDLAASLHVASSVCGNMYNIFLPARHQLCFILADVDVRGVASAMLMGRVVPLLHETILTGASLVESLNRVNRSIYLSGQYSNFRPLIRILAGLLDLQSGLLSFVSAGQHSPIRLRSGQAGPFLRSDDPPLGFQPDTQYQILEDWLHPNDTLFAASNGALTASAQTGEEYGQGRLVEYLEYASLTENCRDIVYGLQTKILQHTYPNRPKDDIVMICLNWKGPLQANEVNN